MTVSDPDCAGLFDQWSAWRWTIKWSQYDLESSSTATLMVFRNDRKIVDSLIDSSFKMGRNDEGRIPHFKIGLYNADGIAEKGEIWVRNYREEEDRYF